MEGDEDEATTASCSRFWQVVSSSAGDLGPALMLRPTSDRHQENRAEEPT